MIGIWHAIVQSPSGKLKLKFNIEESNSGYKIAINMEPFPLLLSFNKVIREGQCLRATGRTTLVQETDVSLDLNFDELPVRGTLELQPIGAIPFELLQGEGPSRYEDLLQKVSKYRKNDVKERTAEEIARVVENLLAKMSVADKIGQMSQCLASNYSFGSNVDSEPSEQLVEEGKVGSILGAFDSERVFELQKLAVEKSPYGIPLLFNADIIHGHQTIFPVPLAWSCSWDMDAIRGACAIAAKEASASGITYNHGPMVDVTRDPRWGRVVEGAGEDPYLGSLIAEAQVKGFQGDSLFNQETIIACLKHFIAYGAAEGGRDYNTVDISEGTLRNVFLPPFQAGIQAGAGSVMNSFNIYQGVPVAGNQYLLKDLLRDELGFDGMLISDYGAIEEIHIHGCAENEKEAARMALSATMDIEMVTRTYAKHLPELVHQGVVKEEQLDEAVRRILTYKYKIGIMDDPFRYIRPEKEQEYHFADEHLKESRELARKSIVLLKNDGVLPLDPTTGTVAIVGPFATSKDLLGSWQFSGYGDKTITLEQGFIELMGTDRLLIAEGCKVDGTIDEGFETAIRVAKEADVVVLALGESSQMSGEAASRMKITIPDIQRKLAEEIIKLGKPTVLVLTNGRPLALDWIHGDVNAIVETWFLGSQAGYAIADVLFGKFNPSGKLTMSFPYCEGQIPVYYNRFNTGRPVTETNKNENFISKYSDGPNDPLYPFGYGLSYTTFTYSEIELDKTVMTSADSISVNVTVTNSGRVTGEEIVQMYIRDLYGSTVRPLKELKGFEKINLEPGESKEVHFTISVQDLTYYTANRIYQAEPGDFHVYVGTNSQQLKEAKFKFDCEDICGGY
jgi:beta-glucosidase